MQLSQAPPSHTTSRGYLPIPIEPHNRESTKELADFIRNMKGVVPSRTYVEVVGVSEKEIFNEIPKESFLPGEELITNKRTVAQLILDGHRNIGGHQIDSVVTKITPTKHP